MCVREAGKEPLFWGGRRNVRKSLIINLILRSSKITLGVQRMLNSTLYIFLEHMHEIVPRGHD